MSPRPTERAPIDVVRAEREDQALRHEIAGRPLFDALARYHARMDALVAEALGGAAIACGPGCATCCHQPLLVSFLELAAIFFSDERRFGSPEFRRALSQSNRALARWKKEAGAEGAVGVARRQFASRAPCVLLGEGGRCTAYAVRPFLCRNAVADAVCTFASLGSYGFGDLAALARRLRQRLVETYALERFDRPPVRVATAVFHLPEGLAWFADHAPRGELRATFARPDAP